MGAVTNFLLICRANVQVVSFATATLGVLLGADILEDVLNWDVLVYVLLFFVLITFACNINCFCDVEVDSLRKKDLYKAVSYFGKIKMKALLSIEIAIAILLSIFLSLRGHLEVAILAIAGLFLGWSYSSLPLRIKSKGIIGPAPVILGVYVLPILAGYLLVNKNLTLFFLLFVVGYALMNLGINLVNTCEDYGEDKKLGITTFALELGLRRTLNLAFVTTAFGGILALACLFTIGFHSIFPLTLVSILAFIFITISCFTVAITAKEIFIVGQANDLEKSAKKHAKNMPKWFVITRYPMWFYALILLFV